MSSYAAEWDIRRYGETQLAIRFLPGERADAPTIDPRAEGAVE